MSADAVTAPPLPTSSAPLLHRRLSRRRHEPKMKPPTAVSSGTEQAAESRTAAWFLRAVLKPDMSLAHGRHRGQGEGPSARLATPLRGPSAPRWSAAERHRRVARASERDERERGIRPRVQVHAGRDGPVGCKDGFAAGVGSEVRPPTSRGASCVCELKVQSGACNRLQLHATLCRHLTGSSALHS